MQNILTVLIESIVFGFSLLMALDFIAGLKFFLPTFSIPGEVDAFAPSQLEQAIAPPTALYQPIELPDPWTLPTSVEDATTTPLLESWQLTKPTLLLLPSTQESAKHAEANYSRLSIRQLKKLASAAKICRYNVMTKNQLIQALAV